MAGRQGNWLRYMARAIALAWALFWVYFGLASGLSEGLNPAGVLLHTALPGLVFLACAVVAWRWEPGGGIALLLAGLFVLVLYPIAFGTRFPTSTVVFVLLTMALPPAVAGLLLLANWRSRKGRIAQS